MANLEHEIRITPSTVFPLASVSKQFTAFAIAMLADRGKLSLDDDVREYLPEVPDFGRPITLRHLIHHTSGLRDSVELLLMAGYEFRDVYSRSRYWNLISNQRDLNFDPGTKFEYSNTGYFLLAEVVERVSGMRLGDWLEREVFGPLGMDSATVVHEIGELVPGMASAYEGSVGEYRQSPICRDVVGECGVHATVGDLARWLDNFRSGQVGGDAVLLQMQEQGRLSSGGELPYAFGLLEDEHLGRRRLGHGGRSNGYVSHASWYPDERLGVAVLCNGYPMRPLLDPSALADQVAELFFAEGDVELATSATPRASSFDAPSADSLKALAGMYWAVHRNYLRRIDWTGTELVYQGEPLRAIAESTFAVGDTGSTMLLVFSRSSENEARFHLCIDAQPPQLFVAVEEPVAPTLDQLRRYEGSYWSPELRVVHEYRVRDGGLWVECTGHAPARLRSVIRDHFNQGAPWWLGYDIHFQRAADDSVSGVLVSNYHVKRVRFVKLDE